MKKGAWVLALFVVAALGWWSVSRDTPDAHLVFDRFWVDHQAADRDETFEALFVNAAKPWGTFATRTFFRGKWEAFHYHVVPRQAGRLKIAYPATDEREDVVVSARKCNEKGFDYCLDITGNSRGKHRYYSRKEWHVDGENPDAIEEHLRAELAPAPPG